LQGFVAKRWSNYGEMWRDMACAGVEARRLEALWMPFWIPFRRAGTMGNFGRL
jgi:hypothetical protein